MREYDSVASSFSSTRKLAQGNESVASVEGSVLREKRDRDLNSVRTLSDRQHFHDHLERKAELTVRGEVTCDVAPVGLRRIHHFVSSAVCTRCAWLECLSFLSFAIGRLLRFQPGLASRLGSLRFVATSRSANTPMRQVTAKLTHQLADGTADRCAAIPVFPQRLGSPRRTPLGPSAANGDSSRTRI